MPYKDWFARSIRARRVAHSILARHEGAISRVVLLEDLLKKLSGAPIDVQDYFSESVACLERGLFRSGVVLAWSGHFYVFLEQLFLKYEADIHIATDVHPAKLI